MFLLTMLYMHNIHTYIYNDRNHGIHTVHTVWEGRTGYRDTVSPCIDKLVDGGVVGFDCVCWLEMKSILGHRPDGQAARAVPRPQVGAAVVDPCPVKVW